MELKDVGTTNCLSSPALNYDISTFSNSTQILY